MGEDYFIGLGIAQIFCGLTTIGTQVHRKDHLYLDLKIGMEEIILFLFYFILKNSE